MKVLDGGVVHIPHGSVMCRSTQGELASPFSSIRFGRREKFRDLMFSKGVSRAEIACLSTCLP